MAGAPVAHVGEHRDQVVAGFGEVIGYLRRYGRFYFALNDPIFFELPQLRGENFFTNAGEQIAQFSETAWVEAEMPDQQHLPLPA